MSLQTEAMRDGADKTVTAFLADDGKWYGVELVNHPTPSGCDRWLPTYSDKRGWPDKETALRECKQLIASAS